MIRTILLATALVCLTGHAPAAAPAASRPATSPTGMTTADIEVLRDSQQEALNMVREMQEKADDPKTLAIITKVITAMEQAVKLLEEAKASPDKLQPALTSEQAAYKAALELAAHVYQVTQNKNQKGKGKGQGKDQHFEQQLEQLEMKKAEDRYEKQSKASPLQTEEQKEQLQILNRLKELAQRQQDLNERMKELQTALEAAKSDEQKEDIRRQLKRLQEEQQQMLADIDEVKQKMEQSKDQSRYAEERKQLDRTRQQAERAAQSLEENKASEALASGARTQRELEQLRDEVRKKSSQQFTDEMRQMRDDARELAKNEEQLSKQIESLNKENGKRRSLGDPDNREQIAQQLEKQRSGLTNVLENMKRVSEAAEIAEPLLARELYETVRKQSQRDTDQNLQMVRELVNRGYTKQAAPLEEKARKDIDELKDGVERAAQGVLGDEAEALRMARAELDQLNEQIQRELAQRAPELADAPKEMSERQPGQRGQRGEPSESKEGAEGDKQKGAQAGKEGEPKAGQKSSQSAKTGKGQPSEGQPKGQGQKLGQQGEPSDQPGAKPGESPAQMAQAGGQQPGQAPGKKSGQQPGQKSGQTPGKGAGQQPGEKPDQQAEAKPGEPGSPATSGQQPGESSAQAQPGANQIGGARRDGASRLLEAGQRQIGGVNNGGWGGNVEFGPLVGDGFIQWSDRLRNVEEMLNRPELRNDAARIREIARAMRIDYKRTQAEPKWDLVKLKISAPLAELRNRVTEELARVESKDALVPIDRDPVPGKYSELVRRYYERLGSDQ